MYAFSDIKSRMQSKMYVHAWTCINLEKNSIYLFTNQNSSVTQVFKNLKGIFMERLSACNTLFFHDASVSFSEKVHFPSHY